MKIIFLNFYSGLVNRGGETFVSELAGRLTSQNEVYVFQGGDPIGTEKYHVIEVNIPKPTSSPLPVTHLLRRLFLDEYKLKELFFTLKSLPKLFSLKPNIIIPLNSGWQALILSIYSHFFGSKLVIAGQSGPGWDDRWNLLMKPDLFVALTEYQKQWAEKASIWKTLVTKIPNGVDLHQFSSKGDKAKIKLKSPVILCVAASNKAKRVIETVEAVSRTKSSLLLLGQGEMDNKINKVGANLLKERFLHLSVTHDEMPKYYRAADLFTLCSESSEAFGIVYLEAMAAGLGCVGTDDPSRREIIGKAGMYIKDPGNLEEYSGVLEKSLTMNWQKFAQEQAKKFSWDNISIKYQEKLIEL